MQGSRIDFRFRHRHNVSTVGSRYSGHLRDVVLCPEKRESVIPGVIFRQTSRDFVRNSECP